MQHRSVAEPLVPGRTNTHVKTYLAEKSHLYVLGSTARRASEPSHILATGPH
jgi:hypothetical protein